MYPPQTSFIPVTVALVRFVETNGFSGLYPYWYLGTTPVKYLIGPVVPVVLVFLHKILPNFSLFDLSLWLVVACQLLFSLGWGVLAWRLSSQRKIGIIVGLISLFAPWHWVSALGLGEVSAVVAQALTPWVLLGFSVQGLGSSTRLKLVPSLYTLVPSVLFALLLLTNTTAAIPAVVGLVILAVVGGNSGKLGKLRESDKSDNQKIRISGKSDSLTLRHSEYSESSGLKRAILVILLGWAISTFWYGPGYWLTIFGAPSIGGKSAVSAFVNLINLLRGFVPVILAVVLVFWKIKQRGLYDKFVLAWLTIFGSLTLFRFMADPDFWMDWTSWMGEVEVGIALLIAGSSICHFEKAFGQFLSRTTNDSVDLTQASARHQVGGKFAPKFRLASSSFSKWLLSLLIITFIGSWAFAFVHRDFWMPRKSIEDTVEYKIAKWLEIRIRGSTPEGKDKALGVEPLQGSTVFLSGTTAFWLNSLVDVVQVRGGRDEVSKNAQWRGLNWQLTQGESLDSAVALLKAQGVDFIVVHGDSSQEYYHDFVDPEKFEKIPSFEKVYDKAGDVIYKLYK